MGTVAACSSPRPTSARVRGAHQRPPAEIGFIPNTSTGENFVVEALNLRAGRDNVVTDGLHFEGALVHLMERKNSGLDVRVVMPRDGRIHLTDLEHVSIGRNQARRGVARRDVQRLPARSEGRLRSGARARGLVYADIIQGVGAVPFDVSATGVDFAATSTYKWLMGDFGLGFMFVKAALLDARRAAPALELRVGARCRVPLVPDRPGIAAGHRLHPGK